MPVNATNPSIAWLGVTIALVYPTLATLIYFVGVESLPASVQQAAYLVVKIIQFTFPVVWVWLVLRERPRWQRPTTRGLALGVIFALMVVIGGWLLFELWLRETSVFQAAAALIYSKLGGFAIESRTAYAALALFYSFFHSLLEEYYWRWFVFGQLRRLLPLWPAVLVSALGFMGHHVVVLGQFFGGVSWLALLLAAAVGVGGVFWAWLYDRAGSLYAPWLSHLLIDAGIFWLGYRLLHDVLT